MSNYIRALALLLALAASNALARDYVVEVNGIVCEFCAYGVSKKVSKLPFVDRSKYNKGVRVAIENQRVTVAVIADANLDRDALYEAILDGGYEPVALFERAPDGTLRNVTDES